ncbi:hypothetical protein IWX47DRAFT_408164 [Phyllosticta citricarpa]
MPGHLISLCPSHSPQTSHDPVHCQPPQPSQAGAGLQSYRLSVRPALPRRSDHQSPLPTPPPPTSKSIGILVFPLSIRVGQLANRSGASPPRRSDEIGPSLAITPCATARHAASHRSARGARSHVLLLYSDHLTERKNGQASVRVAAVTEKCVENCCTESRKGRCFTKDKKSQQARPLTPLTPSSHPAGMPLSPLFDRRQGTGESCLVLSCPVEEAGKRNRREKSGTE